MRARLFLLALAASMCCTPDPQPDGECASQAAELRTWLRTLLDRARPLKAPWPTGDPTLDARIETARDIARAEMRPRYPTEARRQLTPGIRPGQLEHELAPCPPALRQLARVGEVSPARAQTTFAGIADAIAACACRVNLPYVKALFYVSFRGPD